MSGRWRLSRFKKSIEAFRLDDDKVVYLLSQGNLVNLAAGDGNPIAVMDLGLALQSLSLAYLAENSGALEHIPQTVPSKVENRVAQMALAHWT